MRAGCSGFSLMVCAKRSLRKKRGGQQERLDFQQASKQASKQTLSHPARRTIRKGGGKFHPPKPLHQTLKATTGRKRKHHARFVQGQGNGVLPVLDGVGVLGERGHHDDIEREAHELWSSCGIVSNATMTRAHVSQPKSGKESRGGQEKIAEEAD